MGEKRKQEEWTARNKGERKERERKGGREEVMGESRKRRIIGGVGDDKSGISMEEGNIAHIDSIPIYFPHNHLELPSSLAYLVH